MASAGLGRHHSAYLPVGDPVIRFRVNGTPAPQGSKRHVGNGRMVESSKAVGPWREAVRAEAQKILVVDQVMGLTPRDAPVSLTIVFVLARPKGHLTASALRGNGMLTRPSAPKYPATRPDLDKLARAILDGLVMGGVMADDAQVVSLNCAKVYASNGEAPGAIIEVEAL